MTAESRRKFERLLGELRDLTARGRVAWNETLSERRFISFLENGSVEIEQSYDLGADEEEIAVYLATLLNRDGRVVATISTQPPDGCDPAMLAELFRSAQANARKSDEVFDKVLNELESLAGKSS
jgi:hypothetical protein